MSDVSKSAATAGAFLRFYVHEHQSHHFQPVWEWLLMKANKLGVRGGSAFNAASGFGRHHKIVERKLFDLSGSAVIEVEFIVTKEEAQKLLDLVHHEKIQVFFACVPAHFGVIDINAPEPPSLAHRPLP